MLWGSTWGVMVNLQSRVAKVASRMSEPSCCKRAKRKRGLTDNETFASWRDIVIVWKSQGIMSHCVAMSFIYQHITLIQHQLLKIQKHRPSSMLIILVHKCYIKIHRQNWDFFFFLLLESLIPRLLFTYAFICINPVRAAKGNQVPGSTHTVRLFR